MAEELDLHLLELARAEGEVPRRDLVAETLADLGDAEGNPHPRAVADVLEVDEDALGRLGAEKRRILFAAQRAGDRLEHQVELPRLGQRAEGLGVGAEDHATNRSTVVSGTSGPSQASSSASLPRRLKNFMALCCVSSRPSLPASVAGHEDALPLARHPAAVNLIVAIPLLRLPAIDHVVVEQVVVARALPDLRVHDDRAVEAGHFVGRRGAGRDLQLVVGGDHVAPPGLADVPLQLHAQRAVVPKALQAAVDFARLKEKSPPLAQGHQLIHFHDNHTKSRVKQISSKSFLPGRRVPKV